MARCDGMHGETREVEPFAHLAGDSHVTPHTSSLAVYNLRHDKRWRQGRLVDGVHECIS